MLEFLAGLEFYDLLGRVVATSGALLLLSHLVDRVITHAMKWRGALVLFYEFCRRRREFERWMALRRIEERRRREETQAAARELPDVH